MNVRFAVPAILAAVAAFALAPLAHADDAMYRVGVDISPGDYTYTVVGNGTGSWQLCSTANCDLDGLIDMDQISGMGQTGYMTVTPQTKFVKTNDLILTPM